MQAPERSGVEVAPVDNCPPGVARRFAADPWNVSGHSFISAAFRGSARENVNARVPEQRS